jgi:hypothetical protein
MSPSLPFYTHFFGERAANPPFLELKMDGAKLELEAPPRIHSRGHGERRSMKIVTPKSVTQSSEIR